MVDKLASSLVAAGAGAALAGELVRAVAVLQLQVQLWADHITRYAAWIN